MCQALLWDESGNVFTVPDLMCQALLWDESGNVFAVPDLMCQGFLLTVSIWQ